MLKWCLMEGGTSIVFKQTRVFSFGKFIPLSWWIPQKERAVLAVVSTFFWSSALWQAWHKDAAGASVLAFYGLGLFYTACVLANVGGGARTSLLGYRRHRSDTEQSRALVQLFGIMAGMFVCNAVVFGLYLQKGTSATPLDMACAILALAVLSFLFGRYGWLGAFRHPFARGYMSAACKALPQLLLAGLFLAQPPVAQAFSAWSLGSLAVLAALRCWPSLLAFRRDRSSAHIQGLMIGESANMFSVICMLVTWVVAARLV